MKVVGRAKRAEVVSPEGERTKAGGEAAEPRTPCNAEKKMSEPREPVAKESVAIL